MKYVLLFLLMAGFVYSKPCCCSRFDVKTLTDDAAGSVNLRDTVNIDFSGLHKLDDGQLFKRGKKFDQMPRLNDERTLYRLVGRIVKWTIEDDQDFHLCIISLDGRDSIVCEIPSPECEQSIKSGQAENYRQARELIESLPRIKTTRWKFIDPKVVLEIVGVSFHDFKHNANGAMPNCLELHPVVRVKRVK